MTVEEWVKKHRQQGHSPYPSPTDKNPERWLCQCEPGAPWRAVWRILTLEQIEQKYAHLGAAARRLRIEEQRAVQNSARAALTQPTD